MQAVPVHRGAMLLVLSLLHVVPGRTVDASDPIHLLSTTGSTRATRYASANKIVSIGDKTHVAWLDSVSRTMIATYDHATDQWSDAVHVGDGVDNHGGPALTCDSRGFLHIVFGPHAREPFQHYQSASANDAAEWVRRETFGDHATYPSLVCDPADTLHIVYRGGPKPDHPFALLYQRLPAGGEWSEPAVLARCPDEWDGYTHYHHCLTIDSQGAMHVAFNFFYDGRALEVGYLKSTSEGRTWLRADGESAALPVSTGSGAIILQSQQPLNVINIACDERDTPWIGVNEQNQFTLRRYEGGEWRASGLNQFLEFDHTSRSLNWGAFTIGAGGRLRVPVISGRKADGGGDVWLLTSDPAKQHFRQTRMAAADTQHPHTGATLERFTGHNRVETPWLLFSTGDRGSDTFGIGIHHRVSVRNVE